MKIIYNNILPFKGFKCVNLFGILFARKGANITQITVNHESIHSQQMKELLYLPFYIWYIIEWLIRLFLKGNAYRNISFEREAYSNERNADYLSKRKHFAFLDNLK